MDMKSMKAIAANLIISPEKLKYDDNKKEIWMSFMSIGIVVIMKQYVTLIEHSDGFTEKIKTTEAEDFLNDQVLPLELLKKVEADEENRKVLAG